MKVAKQKTFNLVVGGLLKQGEPSYGVRGPAYRIVKTSGKVCKCAAGQLIPDKLYDEAMEGLMIIPKGVPIRHWAGSATSVIEKLGHDRELVHYLQQVHDGYIANGLYDEDADGADEEFVRSMKVKYRACAKHKKLSAKIIDKFD